MIRRLDRELARRFIAAAESGEWLPIGTERERAEYWLPERVNAREWLYLIDFDDMDDDAAESLAMHKGRLTLTRLFCMSDASAQALSRHQGGVLELDGLASLSDAAAQSLSEYQGFLSLDGILSLTDVAADALSQRQGGLSLDGLTTLADTQGHLCSHGSLRLSPEALEITSRT